MSDTRPAYVPVDAPRLIAALRKGDEATIKQAYEQVFGGPLGRLVLAHALKQAQVGAPRPPGMAADERTYFDGAAFAVLGMAGLAGFDQASVLLAIFTDELEGPDYAPGTHPGARARADADADADADAHPDADPDAY